LGALLIGIIVETKERHNNLLQLKNHSNLTWLDNDLDFDYKSSCGSNNCPLTPLKKSLSQPTESSVIILYTSMCIICIISIANVFIFTDDLNDEKSNVSKEKLSFKLVGKLEMKIFRIFQIIFT